MRVAVLGNQANWSFDELRRAGGNRHSVEFLPWPAISARLDRDGSARFPAGEFDAVVVRGMPLGSLEQVVFQMNLLARWEASGVRVLNSPRSLEIAIDKYLSLALIHAAGIPVPRTAVGQTVDDGLAAFEWLGGDVVVKPIFGGEGRGLFRVTDPELALRSFRAIVAVGGVIYQQQFIQHGGFDVRLLVLGNETIGMRRENAGDWRTNASRGAQCRPWTSSEEEVILAQAAARATCTTVAGVDLVRDEQGKPYILEVNGVPGWQGIARVTGVDVAQRVIGLLERG
jgi:ribosomal protein S6--L-glutamate ligase